MNCCLTQSSVHNLFGDGSTLTGRIQSAKVAPSLIMNFPILHVLCELCCTLLVLHVLIRVALPLTLRRSLPVILLVHCYYLAVVHSVRFIYFYCDTYGFLIG